MCFHQVRQGRQVIAALEHGDHPAVAMDISELAELMPQGDETLTTELHSPQRVARPGIESSRKNQGLGSKIGECRQNRLIHRLGVRSILRAGR